jgi:hypothetical protein
MNWSMAADRKHRPSARNRRNSKMRCARSLSSFFPGIRKNTGLKMEPKTHHRRETQPAEILPVEPNVSLSPTIGLIKKDRNKQTLGFPPLNLAEPKRVIFSTPICARCVSADGLWSTNCLVLCVWDTGAQLQVSLPGDLTQFYLLFTSSQKPVSRQCRRVSICGNVIEVAYLRKQPAFLLNAGLN